MPVNSPFRCFFNNRLVVESGICIVMLGFLFIASAFTDHSDRDLRARQTNLIIREIGHRLLLQAGDSTSRVMPVTEIQEGIFMLEFENDFVFNHDSLMVLAQGLLPKTQFPSGYTVTVHECANSSIVYGFQVNNFEPDILACKGRSQPAGCYTIEIAFRDLYGSVEQKNGDIDGPTGKSESTNAILQEAEQKLQELKSAQVDHREAGPKPEELKSSLQVGLQARSKLEDSKTQTFEYRLVNIVFSGMLVALSVALLIGRFGKSLSPVTWQTPDQSKVKESVPELSALGKFLFDVKDQRLLLGSEVISLTDKECRVLELLYENFGELIPRESLMQKVWINEGVITGRSLDMFVSKLRKKLSSDPDLRITNVHGKGYKLEVSVTDV